MAHLSHELPWKQLASNFRYAESPRKLRDRTNLVPAKGVQQALNIEHFAHTFEETIKKLSSEAKLEYTCRAPQTDEHASIVDSKEKAVMRNSLNYARDARDSRGCGCCCPLHYHRDLAHSLNFQSCQTAMDPHELGSWLGFFGCGSCCDRIGYSEIVNQTKIMLMYGMMEPLLRLASNPYIHIEELYWFPFDNGGADGWSELLEAALCAYLSLNVLYLMPTIWPSFATPLTTSAGQTPADYRRTAVYQRAVIICTATRRYDVHTLPHRFFFGIPRDTLTLRSSSGKEPLVGLFTLRALFTKEAKDKHFPSTADVDMVSHMLRLKGLPVELVRLILDFASYTPQSRLKIPDDPLHPENEEELKKYLSYCWKLLIRCNILAEASGKDINWMGEVKSRLVHLFYEYPGYPKVFERAVDGRPGNWIRSTAY